MGTGINKDTALVRGIRTALQTMGGLIVGLILAVWAVPGVPDAVADYLSTNLIPVLLTVGVPSGLIGFMWNAFRRDVKTV